jgi:hypothetical protein
MVPMALGQSVKEISLQPSGKQPEKTGVTKGLHAPDDRAESAEFSAKKWDRRPLNSLDFGGHGLSSEAWL